MPSSFRPTTKRWKGEKKPSVWTEGNVLHFPFLHASKWCYVIQSLVLHYPNFQRILRESLRLIVGEEVEKRVEIGVVKDGSRVSGKKMYFSFDFLWLIFFFIYCCTLCTYGFKISSVVWYESLNPSSSAWVDAYTRCVPRWIVPPRLAKLRKFRCWNDSCSTSTRLHN